MSTQGRCATPFGHVIRIPSGGLLWSELRCCYQRVIGLCSPGVLCLIAIHLLLCCEVDVAFDHCKQQGADLLR